MIFIKHRINTIKDLLNTPCDYGVEIDLRSENGNIYLHHDPFKKGILFKKWLNYFNHKIIVLNVKEEGLENKIINLLKKKKITKFFFHDQTFSSLLKEKSRTNVSIRFSEYEELKKKKILFKKIKWLWLDNFNQIDINKNFYNFLKKNKVKICLVSPELVNKNRKKELELIYRRLTKKKMLPDAVCTKHPETWEKLIRE
jgi:hypothetical protein